MWFVSISAEHTYLSKHNLINRPTDNNWGKDYFQALNRRYKQFVLLCFLSILITERWGRWFTWPTWGLVICLSSFSITFTCNWFFIIWLYSDCKGSLITIFFFKELNGHFAVMKIIRNNIMKFFMQNLTFYLLSFSSKLLSSQKYL